MLRGDDCPFQIAQFYVHAAPEWLILLTVEPVDPELVIWNRVSSGRLNVVATGSCVLTMSAFETSSVVLLGTSSADNRIPEPRDIALPTVSLSLRPCLWSLAPRRFM